MMPNRLRTAVIEGSDVTALHGTGVSVADGKDHLPEEIDDQDRSDDAGPGSGREELGKLLLGHKKDGLVEVFYPHLHEVMLWERDGRDLDKAFLTKEIEDRGFVVGKQGKGAAVVEGEKVTAAFLVPLGPPEPVQVHEVTAADLHPPTVFVQRRQELVEGAEGLHFPAGEDGAGFTGLLPDGEKLIGVDVFDGFALAKSEVEAGMGSSRDDAGIEIHSSSLARSSLRFPPETGAVPLTLGTVNI